MTQPLVATRRGGISRKMTEIATFMALHPQGCTPKMISSGTSLNVNTVKSILPKLKNITTIARGFYKVLNGGDTPSTSCGDLSAWNFHNLILSVPIIPGHLCLPKEYNYDLIKLVLTLHEEGRAVICVSTDYPINVSSICILYGLIRELIKQYLDHSLEMNEVKVHTMEFNQDHANLKLDGVNCITLDSLCTQFKIYQKSIGLRIEHKTKVNFNVENMIDMLTGSSTTIDLSARMTEQTERLIKLTGQTVLNTQLLNKLIEARQ